LVLMRSLLLAFLVAAVSLAGCVVEQEPEPMPPGPEPFQEPAPEPEPEPMPEPEPAPPVNETHDESNCNQTLEPEPEPEVEPGPKPVWGDPELAPIYPGVYASTDRTSCTTNFLFTSPDHHRIFIGMAAHCFGGEGRAPCDASAGMPVAPGVAVRFYVEFGTTDVIPVTHNVEFHNLTGVLVYNSWYTQRVLLDEPGAPECTRLNDFALVELPLEAQGLMTPVWRHFGIAANRILEPGEINVGDPVIGYGHSHNWLGVEPLYPKHGVVTRGPFEENGHWNFVPAVVPHGIFGDSGSPVMSPGGGAMGVMVLLAALPNNQGEPAFGNSSVTLHTALAYMEEHTSLRVVLAQA
jgi:hypothetical protein